MTNFLRRFALCGAMAAFILVSFAAAAEAPTADERTDGLLYRAVDIAHEMMNAKDIYDRILAAGALSDLGDADALALLKRCLAVDDIVIRRSAIDTLITTSHPDTINLLFQSATQDADILGLTAQSLAAVPRPDMRDLLLAALGTQNSDFVRRHALQALGRATGAGENELLRKLVADTETSSVIRAYAQYALLIGGDAGARSAMLAAAGEDNPDVREVAAVALGSVDTAEAKEKLAVLARESDPRVALAAVASEAALGSDDAVGQIIKTIGYGRPLEAGAMAGALRRLPPGMASQITDTLLGCCPLKTEAAARLLESWGWIAGDASKVYDWGLKHQDSDIRLQTIWLIGQRKDEAALPRLAPFLEDSDPGIRGMAAWSIIHTTGYRYTAGTRT